MPFLGALSVAIVCVATPAASSASVDAAARAAFLSGQELFRAGQFSAAAGQFEKAYSLKPHFAIYFNIARCHEELGNAPSALRAYRSYLAERPDAADREEVDASIAGLERQLKAKGVQQLMVLAEPADSLILIDGAAIGRSPAFVELPPGDHRVRIAHAGLETVSRSFVMSTHKSMELSYVLQPPALPAFALEPEKPVSGDPLSRDPSGELKRFRTSPSRQYPLRKYAWLPITASAVGAGLAAGGFVMAATAAKDLDLELASQGGVTARAQDLAVRGKTEQTLAWVGVGLAGVGAVTSIIFLATTAEAPVSPVVSVFPGGASLGLAGVLP